MEIIESFLHAANSLGAGITAPAETYHGCPGGETDRRWNERYF